MAVWSLGIDAFVSTFSSTCFCGIFLQLQERWWWWKWVSVLGYGVVVFLEQFLFENPWQKRQRNQEIIKLRRKYDWAENFYMAIK